MGHTMCRVSTESNLQEKLMYIPQNINNGSRYVSKIPSKFPKFTENVPTFCNPNQNRPQPTLWFLQIERKSIQLSGAVFLAQLHPELSQGFVSDLTLLQRTCSQTHAYDRSSGDDLGWKPGLKRLLLPRLSTVSSSFFFSPDWENKSVYCFVHKYSHRNKSVRSHQVARIHVQKICFLTPAAAEEICSSVIFLQVKVWFGQTKGI